MRGPIALVATAVLVASAASCGGASRDVHTVGSPCGAPGASHAGRPPTDARDYDPGLFSSAVTNRWYPLRPGTRLFYRGSSVEDGVRLRHTVDAVVTDLTKPVDGVSTAVVWERDFTEGELVEAELALFATDRYGNVWHMGEYPEEYEKGRFAKAPAWVHGLKGACAGITIPGRPRPGTSDYAQGYAPPPISWVDRGRVHRVGARLCAPAGCYSEVVVVEEFEQGADDAFQDKYYAPGLGVVRVGWRGADDESKEVLELVRVSQLGPAQLASARTQALQMERHAYTVSKDVWARTEPARRTG